MIFTGTGTAIVTPFNHLYSIDWQALATLIELQKSGGVESIIVCGSTGEGATLSTSEKNSLFTYVVESASSHCAVIAGTGTNDTATTIALSQHAQESGVAALLIVTPFYNKPSREGLIRHFSLLADAVDLPIILYNVPGRTGQNVSAELQLEIAELVPSVIATKEASGNIEQVLEIIRNRKSGFAVYAGDDTFALPVCAAGGDGVISVASNYIPGQISSLVRAALAGDLQSSRELLYKYFNVMQVNFIESNPGPVKYILSKMHGLNDAVRPPLATLTNSSKIAVDKALAEAKLI